MICVLKNVKDTLSFDPGVYINKNNINTIEPMKIIITNQNERAYDHRNADDDGVSAHAERI